MKYIGILWNIFENALRFVYAIAMGGSRKIFRGGPAKHSEDKSCSVKCFT